MALCYSKQAVPEDTSHIDLSVFDREDGTLPEGSDGRLARFAGRIVSFANLLPRGEFHSSRIRCRRRPERRPCPGRLDVGRDGPTDGIRWTCPVCRDGGVITNWRNTQWDLTAQIQSGHIVSLLQRQSQHSVRERHDRKMEAFEFVAELISGPLELEIPISRRVRISGDKTLHDLHEILRAAFEWAEEEPYDFMFGAPYEPGAKRYTGGIEVDEEEGVSETRLVALDSLGLTEGQVFGYLFDFGEEWVHRITVAAICRVVGGAVRTCVVSRAGAAPPQHPDPDDLWDEEMVWAELDEEYPMSGLYGPYLADDGPDPRVWSAMDEVEQLMLVTEAHTQSLPECHPPLDHLHLHAMIHCLAETKIASSDRASTTFIRTRTGEGIARHQAVHELGERLVRDLLREPVKPAQTVGTPASKGSKGRRRPSARVSQTTHHKPSE